jgi:flagellin
LQANGAELEQKTAWINLENLRMTRINTNVSSLVAQTRLGRTNNDLQTSLTRLSTGLRINTGKDDPAGLIASEALRSDITSLNKAISNTRRAGQIIATADSALGQVSSMLNNIRGLVVEAANRGALSDNEIAANQLQIDSSLEAVNRIAQTTTFQGRKLLDGSLDFISNVNTVSAVTDARIDKANLGASGSMNVSVEIQAAATRAQLSNTAAEEFNATATIDFGVRASNVLTDISVVAAGITEDVTIEFQQDAGLADGDVTAEFDADTNVLTISGNETVAGTITRGDIASAIDGLAAFSASAGTPAAAAGDFTAPGSVPADVTLTGATIEIEAATAGNTFNGVQVVFETGATTEAAYDEATQTLTVTYQAGTADFDAIAAAIDSLDDFTASATGGGSAVSAAGDIVAEGDTGLTGGGVLLADVVFELVGSSGSETFNFQAGTTNAQIAAAVNLVSDATGVTAEVESDGSLNFDSAEYGARSVVGINIISEGEGGTFRDSLSGIRATGTDIEARVNGVAADGNGNRLSVNTSSLALSLTLDPEASVSSFSFEITGGGALFQLGGEVVSNQQARLGIASVSTSSLGGPSGRLYELGSGQAKALDRDITGAGRVIDEVIDRVTSLRGRLGAFQATTLESNMISLSDTVANLSEAESSIRDADFAQETAQLTRAQILVQSGTAVLGIANQNPQNVLALLR